MTDVTPVVSHGLAALSNMASQFLGRANVEKLLTCIGDEIGDAETAFFALLNQRALSTANGSQLDDIGVRLNLVRAGRTDTEYRIALNYQIAFNIASGTPDQVITLTKLVTGVSNLSYKEFYPAKVRINLFGTMPSVLAVQQLRQLVPVTVGPLELVVWGSNPRVFSFSTTDGPNNDPSPSADGFGTTDDPTLGGTMASIFEVTT